jgi:hypothetical protein
MATYLGMRRAASAPVLMLGRFSRIRPFALRGLWKMPARGGRRPVIPTTNQLFTSKFSKPQSIRHPQRAAPRDHRVVDGVAQRDLAQRLTGCQTLQGFRRPDPASACAGGRTARRARLRGLYWCATGPLTLVLKEDITERRTAWPTDPSRPTSSETAKVSGLGRPLPRALCSLLVTDWPTIATIAAEAGTASAYRSATTHDKIVCTAARLGSSDFRTIVSS